MPRARNVVSLFSNKGGTGKTTVTVNTAVAAALTVPGSEVVVIDADPSSRTTSFLANPATLPRHDLFDFFREPEMVPEAIVVRSQMADNLLVAPNIRGAELFPRTEARKIAPKLQMLMEYFKGAALVLFDMPAGKAKEHLLLSWTTDAYVVTHPLTHSLRAAQELVETLNKETLSRLGTERVVVRGAIANSVVDRFEAERVKRELKLPVVGEIPYSRKIEEANNKDLPVVTYAPEDHSTRAFYNLAEYFLRTGGWQGDIEMRERERRRKGTFGFAIKRLPDAIRGILTGDPSPV
jgi:MinD-like ATPase involved in chromosome partitioning or flagellar assembly